VIERGIAAKDRQFPSKSQSADLKVDVPISTVSNTKISGFHPDTIILLCTGKKWEFCRKSPGKVLAQIFFIVYKEASA
jgi:hypothetical protein